MTMTTSDSPAGSATLRTDPCNLCPRLCGARRGRGDRGVCGADDSVLVARAALHFWEEPPISGVRGSGTVFFSHCPLHCVYCQNAAIASGGAGRAVSIERLAEICLDLEGQGALNVNFVTPTHYSLAIRDAVALARRRGLSLPVVWNTSGYERVEVVYALADTVDVWLADFKYADSSIARRYSHVPDYPEVALAAIKAMLEVSGKPAFDEVDSAPLITRGVVVRHLLLPGALDQSKRALSLLYERFENTALYSIMNQYTPVMGASALERFPELGARVPDAAYEELLDYTDRLGIEDYFWQEGPAAQESFIPTWDF